MCACVCVCNLSSVQFTIIFLPSQCVASHPDTRSQFLAAHIPLYLYPFLQTVSKTRPFEYLRLTSLGVIGALVKVNLESCRSCVRFIYFFSGHCILAFVYSIFSLGHCMLAFVSSIFSRVIVCFRLFHLFLCLSITSVFKRGLISLFSNSYEEIFLVFSSGLRTNQCRK